MKYWILIVLAVLWGGSLVEATAGRNREVLNVCVSIAPQKYFVEKIGGKRVDVTVMVEPGANPANYEPGPRQMVALSRTCVYFSIGVPFENVWLNKMAAVNPDMNIVSTQKGIEKHWMKTHAPLPVDLVREQKQTHLPNSEASAAQGLKDPHIWLSPPLVMIQARNILGGLAAVDPAHDAVYRANYRAFINEIADLDVEIMEILKQESAGRDFMVFHPSWGYFAKAYDLNQIPIEIEGKVPKPADLKQLIAYAGEKDIGVIFVQPQFSTKNAQVIADAVKAEIVMADPLAPDWAGNLRRVAFKFKTGIK